MTNAVNGRAAAIALSMAIVIAAIAGIAVPAGLGWDFANFYDTGRRVLAGQLVDIYDPTTLIGGGATQADMAFWGTPLSAFLYVPLAWLGPKAALVAFKLAGTLAFLATLVILFREYRVFEDADRQWRYAARLALIVLLFQPFWSVYRVGGQTTAFVLLLVTIAMIGHLRGGTWLTAGCLVAAVAIKPAFAFLPASLGILAGWPLLRALAVCGTAAAAASVAVAGWPLHTVFLTVMREGLQASYSWEYNSALYVAADALTSNTPQAVDQSLLNQLVTGSRLLVLGLFAWLAWRLRSAELASRARRHLEFLLATALCLAISRTVWEHYLALLFPLIAYVTASARHLSRGAITLAAGIVVLAVFQNVTFTVFLRSLLGEIPPAGLVLLSLVKSAPLALSVLFLWRYQRELVESHRAPAWLSATGS